MNAPIVSRMIFLATLALMQSPYIARASQLTVPEGAELGILAADVPHPAPSAAAAKNLLSLVKPVDDEELAGMRGGFFTAAGAQFDFGASIETLVNGQLALHTSLNWTDSGPIVSDLSLPAGANSLASVSKTVTVASFASPASPDSALAQSGVTLQTPALGSTQVTSTLSSGMLQNIVVNTASDQTVSQATNITLTIYNFADWQQQIARNSLGAHLANDIMAASGLGAAR